MEQLQNRLRFNNNVAVTFNPQKSPHSKLDYCGSLPWQMSLASRINASYCASSIHSSDGVFLHSYFASCLPSLHGLVMYISFIICILIRHVLHSCQYFDSIHKRKFMLCTWYTNITELFHCMNHRNHEPITKNNVASGLW